MVNGAKIAVGVELSEQEIKGLTKLKQVRLPRIPMTAAVDGVIRQRRAEWDADQGWARVLMIPEVWRAYPVTVAWKLKRKDENRFLMDTRFNADGRV